MPLKDNYIACLCDDDLVALVCSTLLAYPDETSLGETQLTLQLTDGTSIEVTHESAGLAPGEDYWSVTHLVSDESFEMDPGHNLVDEPLRMPATHTLIDTVRDLIGYLKAYVADYVDCPDPDLAALLKARIASDGHTPSRETLVKREVVRQLQNLRDDSEACGLTDSDIVAAYDAYIQTANDADAYASGWRPVSIREFATHEYLNVWAPLAGDAKDAFDYLYKLSD